MKLRITKEWIERMAKAEEEFGDVSVIGPPAPKPVIDYKTLLEKYMAYVLMMEGTTFVQVADCYLAFSKEELDALWEADIQAERRLDNDMSRKDRLRNERESSTVLGSDGDVSLDGTSVDEPANGEDIRSTEESKT